MTPECELDHIVIAARTLGEGASFIKEQLGVDILPGGKHERMGTHNCVMRIGATCYLEVIAIDPEGTSPSRPRWFGLDTSRIHTRLSHGPSLITWVVRTHDIHARCSAVEVDLGVIERMSRNDLHWQITIRKDGSLPMDGLVPSLIQWSGNSRPWTNMDDFGCRLRRLSLQHPDPDRIFVALDSIGAAHLAELHVERAQYPTLAASIETPRSLVTLS